MKKIAFITPLIIAICLHAFAQTTQTVVVQSPNINALRNSLNNINNGSAIANYDRVIAQDPQNATAYFNRGNAKRKSEQYSDAIADYTIAIAIHPDNEKAYFERGVAKRDLKLFDAAIADYDKAIELNSK